jgi:hypothetical protein
MAPANGLLIIERILRDRDSVWEQIGEERDLGRLIRDMLVSSTVALACFGAVLGAFNSDNAALQAVVSAVKLPLLFLVTLAICLPTLYLFNLVFGARLQVRQALALVMVAITVISVLAVAFAPISLFFLITANQYSFYKLLNVGILTLAAAVGLRFLTGGMAALNRHNSARDATTRAAVAGAAKDKEQDNAEDGGTAAVAPAAVDVPPVPGQMVMPVPGPAMAPAGNGSTGTAVLTAPAARPGPGPQPFPAHWAPRQPAPPAEKQASMTLLYVWILLFGFVGTQLAWTLRPFFGSPDKKFEIFRSIDGNFYVDIVRTIGHLF